RPVASGAPLGVAPLAAKRRGISNRDRPPFPEFPPGLQDLGLHLLAGQSARDEADTLRSLRDPLPRRSQVGNRNPTNHFAMVSLGRTRVRGDSIEAGRASPGAFGGSAR